MRLRYTPQGAAEEERRRDPLRPLTDVLNEKSLDLINEVPLPGEQGMQPFDGDMPAIETVLVRPQGATYDNNTLLQKPLEHSGGCRV